MTGTVTDDSGAAIPGATVTVTNEGPGLKLDSVTDENGDYTIRNVHRRARTRCARRCRASRSTSQTGIPVTPGSIVRVNAQARGRRAHRVGHGDHRGGAPQDRQGRRQRRPAARGGRQPAAEPVPQLPGADEPGARRHAAGVPERADRHARPRADDQRQRHERATTTPPASTARPAINVWLPHHAGIWPRPRRSRTSTSSPTTSMPRTGMAGGAAIAVVTKSGTNNVRGSAFFFRSQDECNARQGYFDPTKLDSEHLDHGRHRRRPDHEEQAVLLRVVGAQRRASVAVRHVHGADGARCATATSARCWRSTRTSCSTTPRRATSTAPAARSSPAPSSRQPHQPDRAADPWTRTRCRTTPARTTACRTTCSWPARRRPTVTTTTSRSSSTATTAHQIWRQVLDDGRDGAGPVLPAVR